MTDTLAQETPQNQEGGRPTHYYGTPHNIMILKCVEVFTFNLNRTTPAHAAALPIPHPNGTHVGPGDFLRIFCRVVSCETVFLVPCCCGHRDIKNACFATLALRAPLAPTAPPGAPQVGLPPRPPRLGSSDTRCLGQKQA